LLGVDTNVNHNGPFFEPVSFDQLSFSGGNDKNIGRLNL